MRHTALCFSRSALLLCLLSLALLPSLLHANAAVKHAFITYTDRSGVVLGRDTVTTPIEVCAFVKPREIPYYKPTNYNEEGWQFCQQFDVWITIEYATEAVPAIQDLLEASDTLGSGMSFVLQSPSATTPDEKLLTANEMSGSLSLIDLREDERNFHQSWTLLNVRGHWRLFNEATEGYLKESFIPAFGLLMSKSAQDFDLERGSSPTTFRLRTTDGRYLNLEGTKPELTTTPADIVFRRYRALPYFALRTQAVDEQGKFLGFAKKKLYPAGTVVHYTPPTLPDAEFDAEATNSDLNIVLNEHVYLDLVYRHLTAINALPHEGKAHTAQRYDLWGRPVSATQRGLTIAGGKKSWR